MYAIAGLFQCAGNNRIGTAMLLAVATSDWIGVVLSPIGNGDLAYWTNANIIPRECYSGWGTVSTPCASFSTLLFMMVALSPSKHYFIVIVLLIAFAIFTMSTALHFPSQICFSYIVGIVVGYAGITFIDSPDIYPPYGRKVFEVINQFFFPICILCGMLLFVGGNLSYLVSATVGDTEWSVMYAGINCNITGQAGHRAGFEGVTMIPHFAGYTRPTAVFFGVAYSFAFRSAGGSVQVGQNLPVTLTVRSGVWYRSLGVAVFVIVISVVVLHLITMVPVKSDWVESLSWEAKHAIVQGIQYLLVSWIVSASGIAFQHHNLLLERRSQ